MKKNIVALGVISLAFILTGCNESKTSAQADVKPQPKEDVATQVVTPATPSDETADMAQIPAPVETLNTDATSSDTASTESDLNTEDNVANTDQDNTDATLDNVDDINKLPATAAGMVEEATNALDDAIDSVADSDAQNEADNANNQ